MGKLCYVLMLLSIFGHDVEPNPIYGGVLEGKILTLHQHQREVNPLKTPYIVALVIVDSNDPRDPKDRLYGTCGGTIIGARTVLTAAHCLTEMKAPSVTIFAGVLNLEIVGMEKAQITKGERYVVHDNCKRENKVSQGRAEYCANDVALIRTTQAFDFRPSIQVAVLAGSRSTRNIQKGWIYGWGMTETDENSGHLRKAHMNVSPLATCENAYKRIAFSDNNWCLTSENHKSAGCPGDSGGPFVVNGVVYGVFAFSSVFTNGKTFKKTCDNYPPSVYINIIKYEKWIKENVKKLSPGDFQKHLEFDDGNKHSTRGSQQSQSKRGEGQPQTGTKPPVKTTFKPQTVRTKPSSSKVSNQKQGLKSQIRQPQKNKHD